MIKIKSNIKQITATLQKEMGEIRRTINEAIVQESKRLIHEGFKNQTDPYGKKWDKIKQDNKNKKFDPNHIIEKGFKWTKLRDGVVIENDVPYAIYHQLGTDNIPQRIMVPISNLGLGFWKTPLLLAISQALRKNKSNHPSPFKN